jgi:peptidoglycan/xylan/chitin deacetylase (PgdA/CDA1 family)
MDTPLQKKEALKAKLIQAYKGNPPLQWGEKVTGVRRKLDTSKKVIALTFDACGGKDGNGVDQKLIDYLIKEKIPATLFINGRWIEANPIAFLALANNSLFEIENHGMMHKPLSVSGKSAYHIQGTSNVSSVVDEVLDNADKIEKLTGHKPKFFRSGTAYYDELAVRIVNDLGEEAVNFSVLGDAGATYSKNQVYNALMSSKPGSIVICHMNHPEKQTAAGVIAAIPELRKKGYSFAKLNDYPLL